MLHLFIMEGIICCAMNAFGHQISFKEGVLITRLWEETDFLIQLLHKEFVIKEQITNQQ